MSLLAVGCCRLVRVLTRSLLCGGSAVRRVLIVLRCCFSVRQPPPRASPAPSDSASLETSPRRSTTPSQLSTSRSPTVSDDNAHQRRGPLHRWFAQGRPADGHLSVRCPPALCVLLCAESRPSFGISRFLQANFFRSNAVYIATVLFACVVGSGAYENAFNSAWEINNKGKLYKDMIKNYPGLPPNTEAEGAADEPAAEEEAAEEAAEE